MQGPKLLIWGLVCVMIIAVAIALTRPAEPASQNVDGAGARKVIADGARVIDVRTPAEYAAGHIEGAENVPVDTITKTAGAWDRGAAILVYCATGARSLNAAQWLSAQGFDKVYNLKTGLAGWGGQLTRGVAPATAGSPAASALPVVYEFYSDG